MRLNPLQEAHDKNENKIGDKTKMTMQTTTTMEDITAMKEMVPAWAKKMMNNSFILDKPPQVQLEVVAVNLQMEKES